jgi:signal transduction histidine kinase
MSDAPTDPHWPKLLSLSVHEFRTPMTVVAGYIRMLLKDRAGALTDQQRRLLEEAEKSCGRLTALLAEVSDLANLEGKTATFSRQDLDLAEVLRTAIDQLPELPDRTVHVELQPGEDGARINGDQARLTTAFASIVAALRRELVASDRLFVRERPARDGSRGREILIGDEPTLNALEQHARSLPVFDEWRGGCGLSLAIARRVLDEHRASIWSAPEGFKSGARILFPANAISR